MVVMLLMLLPLPPLDEFAANAAGVHFDAQKKGKKGVPPAGGMGI